MRCPGESAFRPAADNDPGFTRLFVIDYLARGARYNIVDIDHGERDRGLKVWSVDYPLILLQAEHERLLRASGFARTAFYGTYGFEPYDVGTSDRLIGVAWK